MMNIHLSKNHRPQTLVDMAGTTWYETISYANGLCCLKMDHNQQTRFFEPATSVKVVRIANGTVSLFTRNGGSTRNAFATRLFGAQITLQENGFR